MYEAWVCLLAFNDLYTAKLSSGVLVMAQVTSTA